MSRCDAPRFARPSALRAAPSGTGLSTRGHQRGRQGAARKPLEHGTGYHRFHLKNANPWSKNGVRRTFTRSRSCKIVSVQSAHIRSKVMIPIKIGELRIMSIFLIERHSSVAASPAGDCSASNISTR